MTTALKSVCFTVGFLGIVTAGVCIWVLATPVEIGFGQGLVLTKWDGGDPPKVGIATAVLMLFLGIAACIANIEKRFIIFAAGLFVCLVIAIAFMSLAIKDHQDLKKAKDLQNMFKGVVNQYQSPYDRSNDGFKNTMKASEDFMDKMMTKLKVLAAAGAIDSILLLTGIIIFYVKRPKSTSRNTMQMERTL